MSDWENFNFEERIRKILNDEEKNHNQEHHFGKPFLSSYQIAIEFDREYHEDVLKLGYNVGGKGINVNTSLAQYIARELSKNIKDNSITDIEGAFLSRDNITNITYANKIVPSTSDLSMFRLK